MPPRRRQGLVGVWAGLIRSVEAAGGRRAELAIDFPSAGETFHGIWTVPTESESLSNWSIVHDLHVGTLHAGTLRVAGEVVASRTQYLDKVERIVHDLEDRLGEELYRGTDDRREFTAPPPAQLSMSPLARPWRWHGWSPGIPSFDDKRILAIG